MMTSSEQAIVLVATLTPREGALAGLLSQLEAVADEVRAEPGCELWAIHAGAATVVMIEKWASDSALAGHRGGAPLMRLKVELESLLVVPMTSVELTPVGRPGPASAL